MVERIAGCAGLAVALVMGAQVAFAQTIDLPGNARLAAETSDADGIVELPVAAWRDGSVETQRGNGALQMQAWQVQAPGLTTAQLISPLRAQLLDQGYSLRFECDASDCGGFSFRFAIPSIGEPEMHVDLGDYRYLLAEKETAHGPALASLLVSRTAERGFVQILRVAPPGADPAPATAAEAPSIGVAAPATPATAVPANLAEALSGNGHAVLDDLEFETGSSRLSDKTYGSLDSLATFLRANPGARIVLVGHTDTDGSLDGNIALSRKRAAAVKDRLVSRHGIADDRVQAEGIGYLAPLASNQSAEGRALNRRVEAVLLAEN
ncbi:OmpA family protein [Tropicimonas sp. IMCC34043]|uniref:OmpA family protein n=1 Tax=Tropicimonas sp. IMCC34043 TaxID=2248760 RepID=UPI000E24FDF1|nr:OmpA family protein [Tropicimonas sp. IMCC34043]